MKKILLLMMLVLSSMAVNAQNAKGNGEKYDVYCEIVGSTKFLSTKVTIEVDFGQSQWANANLYGADGKKIKFNSMMDALDYMGKRGWKLCQTYAIGSGSSFVYHYIMTKQVVSDEEITENLDIKKD